MSGNNRQNPNNNNVEEFVRENATVVAMHVEENPNNSVNQQHRHMYKCKDCDKEYDSFQALGGHRASHRSSSILNKTLNSEDYKVHQCRICGEGFPTGQALGGHMRKHWLGKVDQQSKGFFVIWKTAMVPYHHHLTDHSCSSSSSVTSNSIRKEVFGYDLNLTPEENEFKNIHGRSP